MNTSLPEPDWFQHIDAATKPMTAKDVAFKKVKIVATIGPASTAPDVMRAMIRAGMDVARLNFSHGSPDDHRKRIQQLRLAAKKENKFLGILQDIQGPKIRVGRFKTKSVYLKRGGTFTITTSPCIGDETRASCTYKRLHEDIKVGHRILLDDGLLFLIVEKIKGRDMQCRVVFGGELKDSKGMNLPDTKVRLSCLTPKDREDLAFGLSQDVDFIALSFVQSAEDVMAARRLIQRSGKNPFLISKIESLHAVQDYERILEASDGIMVARGDLGVECPMEQVPGLQKQIIRGANRAGKCVITATQMLESMTSKPRPTRAEASDVANAVLDGTDAVMLSAETASGDFPVESIQTMTRIIFRTEEYLSQVSTWQNQLLHEESQSITRATTAAAVQAIQSLQATAAVAFTHSGATAEAVSRLRPPVPIFALTPFDRICRRLSLWWGVVPRLTTSMKHTDQMPDLAKKALLPTGLWKAKNFVVILSGTPVAKPGSTNLMKVHLIKD
jgi:pyruvate kinase